MNHDQPAAGEFVIYEPYRGTATCDDPRKLIVPIGSIFRDPENARLHPDKNIRHIRASLRRRGQQKPLVVSRERLIVAGNGTHEGAEREGWTHIWIVVTHLTGAELRAYGISDNATGLSSEWSWERLASQIGELKSFDDEPEMKFETDDLGFEHHQLTPLLSATWEKPSPQENSPKPKQKRPAPTDEGDRADAARPIVVTPNQREVIERAIARVREICDDQALTEGKCLELIAADYLAGA